MHWRREADNTLKWAIPKRNRRGEGNFRHTHHYKERWAANRCYPRPGMVRGRINTHNCVTRISKDLVVLGRGRAIGQ